MLITITTDFGDEFAIAQLYSTIYQINPKAKIITVSNKIEPQNIKQGAFVIQQITKHSPQNSIHIGVVDPGVGTDRKGILIQTDQGYYIGPDNGLFYPAIKDHQIEAVISLDKDKINKNASTTFHGRDIFARTAALISIGKDLNELGYKANPNNLKKVSFQPNEILFIDDYGNIKINNNCQDFTIGQELKLQIKNKEIKIPYLKTFAQVDKGQLLAYQGSNKLLEIAINHGSANQYFKFNNGQIINLK